MARLRAKAGPAFTIDLCEDEQWEVAARAGTTTFWPTGGTTAESYATLSNEVDSICAWRGNGYAYGEAIPVGQKAANAWGLYDVIGGGTAEWVLDSSSYIRPDGRALLHPSRPAQLWRLRFPALWTRLSQLRLMSGVFGRPYQVDRQMMM